MLSMRSVLFSIKDHLPQTWSTTDGLRALFPAGYTASISALQNYVYVQYYQLAAKGPRVVLSGGTNPNTQEALTSYAVANCWLMADGSGRWYFGWRYGQNLYTLQGLADAPSATLTAPGVQHNQEGMQYQAGFAFGLKVNSNAYGYADSSNPPALTTSCNAGTDNVIVNNWPQLFAAGSTAFFQVGFWAISPIEKTLLSFTPLNGSSVACEGEGSGSSLFTFSTPGADCYVAAIIAAAVAGALKAGTPISADVSLVRQIITSPSFSPSPMAQSLSEYIQTPMCEQVIADAKIIATQVFAIQTGQVGNAAATPGVVSPLVSANQIIAAGTAAYTSLTSTKSIPPINLWKALEALNA
jgi:hypothetical protein